MKDFTIPTGTTALAALALLLALSTALAPNGGRASASPGWAAPRPASAGYDLSWWTVGGGWGSGGNSGYTLAGAAGQPDAANLTGGGYTLAGGFWGGVAAAEHDIYLPVVLKSFS
jgi:hypothetical protein